MWKSFLNIGSRKYDDIFLSTATEIRCQEMSKGGLAYEVILAEPVGVPVPRRADSPEKTPSVEEIQEKLKAAEERRRVSCFILLFLDGSYCLVAAR